MRVAVKDREKADEYRRRAEARAELQEHRHPERDRRARDADLDSRQLHADESEHSTEGHDHRECHGEEPDRGRAELRAPEADRNHRQDVIEAGHRVLEPADQSDRLAAPNVSKRRSGHGDGERPEARERPPHRTSPNRIAVRWIVQKAPSDPTA